MTRELHISALTTSDAQCREREGKVKLQKTYLKNQAKAALSSLTLADLMQVDAVRELVEQANWAAKLLEKCEPYLIEFEKRLGAAPSPLLQIGHAVNQLRDKLTPFTEAK